MTYVDKLMVLCACFTFAACASQAPDPTAEDSNLFGGRNSKCDVGLGGVECGRGLGCYSTDPVGGIASDGKCARKVQIEGQLVDENGTPLHVGGLTVTFDETDDNPIEGDPNVALTDRDGHFSITLYALSYSVTVVRASTSQNVSWADTSDLVAGKKVIDLDTATQVPPPISYVAPALDCAGESYNPDCVDGQQQACVDIENAGPLVTDLGC